MLDKEREQALKEYYESKMQQLASQMKASDTKAAQLFEQYSSLLKALEDKELERNLLLDQVKVSNQAVKESKEDLGILLLSLCIYYYFILTITQRAQEAIMTHN